MNGKRIESARTGVSLIETIMVITLLGAAALTSSLLLNRDWIARRGITAATNDIANTLTTVRNTAITNQAIVRVRRIRSRGVEQLQITEDAGPFQDGKSWVVDLGDQIRLRGGPRQLRFSPTGTANRSLNWTVRQRRSSLSGQVTVAPTTGQVTRRLP